MTTKQQYLIGGIVLILLVIAGIGFQKARPTTSDTNQPVTTETATSGSGLSLQLQNLGIAEVASPTPVKQEITATPKARKQMQKPTMQIDQNKKYTAIMKTSAGDIEIAFNPVQTPVTVNNFVVLAREDFYNDTIFHRAIKGFMIQGGDPTGNGTGSPGYRFDDEPFMGEYTRGTVAMANAGPNTNGSQFFIMHQDYALPKNYVIFGKVTKGIEVVDAIATAPVKPSFSGEMSSPVEPVMVKSVEIIEE